MENLIRKIVRKAAMDIVRGEQKKIVIHRQDVERYLGKPLFTADEMFENIPGSSPASPDQHGGRRCRSKRRQFNKAKGFKQTGQLGAVMVESADIAYSFVMAHLEQFGAKPDFFDERFVHIHVPAGATPKDGPSAGITMATALLSMILNKPVRKHLAMTGELTLTGQVLPIGGVKEKIIAARRAGCRYLMFPEGNRKDFDELPEYLKKGMTVQFAENYQDVFEFAFRNPRERRA